MIGGSDPDKGTLEWYIGGDGPIRGPLMNLWYIGGESGNMKQNIQEWAQHEG